MVRELCRAGAGVLVIPTKMTRRDFLALASSTLASHALGSAVKPRTANYLTAKKFRDPLQIPAVLRPIHTDETTDYYEIIQREASLELLRGKRSTIWGYEGLFPGPTIKARQKRTTAVRHKNKLSVPTVVHLHGSATPPDSDGFPTDLIMPGQEKTYFYPNHRAATLWYHDHTMDYTGRNIFMGLAGMYIVEGEEERNLPLPRDEYDVPLIIQDRLFSSDGALLYSPDSVDGPATDTILINGTPWPRMDVSTCKYRFRILNGSNARSFRLALSSGLEFVQIATDGGLLPAPRPLKELPLAMAERIEVIVDFSAYRVNTSITLDDVNQPAPAGSLVQFNVVRKVKDDSRIPEHLSEASTISADRAAHQRTFVFTRGNSPNSEVEWSINGNRFDPDSAIADISLGQVETWRLANHSFRERHNVIHPIHLHLVNFQILERNGKPAAPHETGWKDTVALNVGDEVLIGMRFEGYRGRYLFHCHNLEHEDNGMMARFDVH